MGKYNFPAGSKVRCIDNSGSYTILVLGRVYTVLESVDTDDPVMYVRVAIPERISHPNGVFWVRRFERVADNPAVDLHITGTVVSRGEGVATIDTEHGSIIVPDKLVPEDPDLTLLRKILARYYDTFAKSTARTVRQGGYADRLNAMLDDFKELMQ